VRVGTGGEVLGKHYRSIDEGARIRDDHECPD
jgi:hypothetical protein